MFLSEYIEAYCSWKEIVWRQTTDDSIIRVHLAIGRLGVYLGNEETVVCDALLCDDDFFLATDDEVAALVKRTLAHVAENLRRLAMQHTYATVQHDGYGTNFDARELTRRNDIGILAVLDEDVGI